MRTTILLLFSYISLVGQQSFPNDWIGEYAGNMDISMLNGSKMDAEMKLIIEEIHKDSIWTFTMIISNDKFGEVVKDYRLVRKSDVESTAYILDEQNGILIDWSYLGDAFYSFYDVMESTYATSVRKAGDDILYDLFVAPNKSRTTSMYKDENNAFEVESLIPSQRQTALLSRIKNK